MAAFATCARGIVDVFLRRTPALGLRVVDCRHLLSTSPYHHGPATPPKKPPSAFAAFVQDKMPDISKNNPDVKQPQKMKIAASLWSQLSASEKESMKNTAAERQRQYEVSYQNFLSQLSPEEKKELTETKQKRRKARKLRRQKMELKKQGRPKGPRNAFTLFVRASRQERGNSSVTTFMKGLVDYWKVMPPEEKQTYIEEAKMDRQRYDEEMKEWEDKMKKEGREDLIRVKSRTVVPKKRKAKKRATASKAKKPGKRASASASKTKRKGTAKTTKTTSNTAPSKSKTATTTKSKKVTS